MTVIILVIALVALGVALGFHTGGSRSLLPLAPLVVGVAIAICAWRSQLRERRKLEAFVDESCATLALALEADADEYEHLAKDANEVFRQQRQFTHVARERMQLAKQCFGRLPDMACFPLDIGDTNLDAIRTAAKSVLARKCL